MRFRAFPASAAFRHTGVADGFEVVHFEVGASGSALLRSVRAGVEGVLVYGHGFDLTIAADGSTRSAQVWAELPGGRIERGIRRDDDGQWTVDGQARPDLADCSDLDFEASAVTNSLPVRRMDLVPGLKVQAPAAFVRVEGLEVIRLQQTYEVLDRTASAVRVAYTSATFDFACTLTYDEHGLVLDYPAIAVRHEIPGQRS